MIPKRVDRLADETWVLKDQDYVTNLKARMIEEKLELIRQVINYIINKQEVEK
jgi:hypothetical protein